MSVTIANIQNACEKLGKMNKQQIINLLNDQGLNYYCPSVRQRRLFKTAYRMIRYKNFDTNTNKTGLKTIHDAIIRIGNNIVKPEMSYVPEIETTILNEIETVETDFKWEEYIHKHLLDEQIVTHVVKENRVFVNQEKRKHINEVKASQGKAKRAMAGLKAQLEANKWKYEYLQEHNYFPELTVLIGSKKFDEHISLLLSDFAPEFIKKKVVPWGTPAIAEKLALFRGPYFDTPWKELQDMLVNRKTYESELNAINSKFNVLQFDPKIMAEPDEFEKVVEREQYDTKPMYLFTSKTMWGKINETKAVNHLGLRATPEAFENVAQEIYKISDMPGFYELKLHWGGVRKRKKEYMMKLNEVKNRIDETIESYHTVRALRKRRLGMKKRNWMRKMALEKKRMIGYGYNELKEFREICEEFDALNKMSENMSKEDTIVKIKQDILKIAAVSPKVDNVYCFTRYEHLVGKTDIPAYALKRYQSILRAISVHGDIYESLRYHFKKRRDYINRCKRRLDASDIEDY